MKKHQTIIITDTIEELIIQLQKEKSNLADRILSGEGQFEEGDTISIVHGGEEIARGIVNFNLSDLLKIKGRKSQDIPTILGVRDTYHVVVHRDNLVVLRQE